MTDEIIDQLFSRPQPTLKEKYGDYLNDIPEDRHQEFDEYYMNACRQIPFRLEDDPFSPTWDDIIKHQYLCSIDPKQPDWRYKYI